MGHAREWGEGASTIQRVYVCSHALVKVSRAHQHDPTMDAGAMPATGRYPSATLIDHQSQEHGLGMTTPGRQAVAMRMPFMQAWGKARPLLNIDMTPEDMEALPGWN